MLLQTKLFIPQTCAPLVERQRLIDLIAEGKGRKLILVCAPAGFGKTLLVCQWIQKKAPQIAWVALPTDSYLVLDDYHLIQSETSPVHDIIQRLLQHAPPQFHLVILTRCELPFPIARLRVNHEITEIQGNDLQFTKAETAQFFEHISKIQQTMLS